MTRRISPWLWWVGTPLVLIALLIAFWNWNWFIPLAERQASAALGRPVVAIYGPTDPRHTPPLSQLAQILWLHIECSPCQQRECPLGHQNCMKQILPQAVWQPLQSMLAAA